MVPAPDNTLNDSSRQNTAQSGISLIYQDNPAIDASRATGTQSASHPTSWS